MKKPTKKIGILGGSFDPPHLGHLSIAQDAYEHLGLDCVLFVPTFLSPHKLSFNLEPEKRAEMVEHMIASDKRFLCSRIEVESGKPQYAIDTVKQLAKLYPDTEFWWILGTDQLEKLHTWKSFEELCTWVDWAVFERPGFASEQPETLSDTQLAYIPTHRLEISSMDIRKRILDQLPVYMFLHPAVDQYIGVHNYYRSP